MTKGRETQRGNKSKQTRVSSFNDMKKKINKMQIKIFLAGKSLVYGTIKKLTIVAKS
jgi:hypothetical protein